MRNLALFYLEKRLRGHLTAIFSYLMGGYSEDGATLFSEVKGGVTRGNRHKLECIKFPLKIRKTSSTTRAVKHWTRLP